MRKLLLCGAAALPLLVGACSSTTTTTATGTTTSTPSVNLTQIATDAQTLAGAMPSLVAGLTQANLLSSTQVSSINSYLATINAAAAALAAAPPIVSSDSNLQQIETAVTDLLAVANSVAGSQSLPAAVQQGITAANILLPVVEGVVTVATNLPSAPVPMTVAQARVVLQGMHH